MAPKDSRQISARFRARAGRARTKGYDFWLGVGGRGARFNLVPGQSNSDAPGSEAHPVGISGGVRGGGAGVASPRQCWLGGYELDHSQSPTFWSRNSQSHCPEAGMPAPVGNLGIRNRPQAGPSDPKNVYLQSFLPKGPKGSRSHGRACRWAMLG